MIYSGYISSGGSRFICNTIAGQCRGNIPGLVHRFCLHVPRMTFRFDDGGYRWNTNNGKRAFCFRWHRMGWVALGRCAGGGGRLSSVLSLSLTSLASSLIFTILCILTLALTLVTLVRAEDMYVLLRITRLIIHFLPESVDLLLTSR